MTFSSPGDASAQPDAAPRWRGPVLLVWQPGPGIAATPELEREAVTDWSMALTLAAWADGHGHHGGLRPGPAPGQISCRDGHVLYEVGSARAVAA